MHPDLQLFQRNFVQEVCRCAEMERKLRFMEQEMKLHDITILSMKDEPKAAPVHELVQFEVGIDDTKIKNYGIFIIIMSILVSCWI